MAARDPVAPAEPWRLRLLGAVAAERGVVHIERWPSRAVSLLLARLALWPERQHGRDELVRLLWPGVAPHVGRNRLRQALSTLRGLLEGGGGDVVLQARRQVIQARAGVFATDVEALRAALGAGDRAAVERLYRGELLPGHDAEWVREERSHLAAQVARSLGAGPAPASPPPAGPRTGAAPPPLPQYLTRLIGADPFVRALADTVRAQRLVLLHGPGGAGKTRLAVEAARRLHEAGAFDAVVFVPLATCLTREAMAEAVLLALRHEAGGSAGGDVHERVRQALAGRHMLLLLDNVEQLVEVARSDLASWLTRLPQLHLLVTSRRVLGLDGEHQRTLPTLPLPDAAGSARQHAANPAVALFADRARAVRTGFTVNAGNHATVAAVVRRLHGLPLAIELAASKLRGLGLTELHALLEGNPKAIAAGARDGPTGIALLERHGPRAGEDPRHASMLSVVRWSLARLAPAEHALLITLAVFEGGATLDTLNAATAAISATPATTTAMPATPSATTAKPPPSSPGETPPTAVATAALLDDLVGSAVVFLRDGGGGTRWHVFEPVREVLLWQTDAAALADSRARQAGAMLRWSASLGRAPLLAAVRDEYANLLLAWRWCAQHASNGLLRDLLGSVSGLRWALDDLTLPGEGLAELARLVDLFKPERDADRVLTAQVRALLAEQQFEQGARDAAMTSIEAAMASLPHTLPRPHDVAAAAQVAQVLYAAARLRLRVHDDAAGTAALLERALALLPSEDAPGSGLGANESPHIETLRARAKLLSLRGVLAIRQHGDAHLKCRLDGQVLALWRAEGPPPRVAEGLVNLALALGYLHRTGEQLALLDEARDIAARHGQNRLLAFVCSVRGYALADAKRWDASITSYRECLQLAWDHSAWREWFYALWNLPRSLAHRRNAPAAAMLMAFADRFAAERFGQLGALDLRERRRTRRLLRRLAGAEEAERLWQRGLTLGMAEAMRLALAADP